MRGPLALVGEYRQVSKFLENLFIEGGLAAGQTVLIHAGASGVGNAAVQMAREAGAVVCDTLLVRWLQR